MGVEHVESVTHQRVTARSFTLYPPGREILDALREAIKDILVCPVCQGTLSIGEATLDVRCACCQRAYPIQDGVLIFLQGQSEAQDGDRRFRDALAAEHVRSDSKTLLEIVARHHCVPIMQKQAEKFHARFDPREWILDIGVGYGWHWADRRKGARILGIDMSLGNLVLARHLLGRENNRVVLVCADAAALPIRERSISGLWSVQIFQHFPPEVLHSVLAGLHRILKDEFVMELYNLNPALLHRVIYRLFGKRLPCKGKVGPMELTRLSAGEWAAFWQPFRRGRTRITCGYSELFFHPDLRIRPRRYPIGLEETLVAKVPRLTALFDRQVQVRVVSDGQAA